MDRTEVRVRADRLAACLALLLVLLPAGRVLGMQACDGVPTFADGLAPERVVHVAVRGDDRTADGSAERAYATLGAAVRAARPGTAVRVGPGEYRGGIRLEGVAGRADAPIWIGGEPGAERPVIRGGVTGLHLVGARYVVVHDMEVVGSSGNGVNVDDGGAYDDPEAAGHVVLRGLSVHDIGGDGNQDGIKLSGLRDYWVIGCEIARCGGNGSGSGIDQVGCHRGVIARCVLRELSGSGVQCKGGTEDVEIRWCRFTDAGLRGVNIGGSTGLEYFRPPVSRARVNAEARDVRVLRNVFEGSEAAVAFVGAEGCVVSGNTIVRPRKWVLRILQETRGGDGVEFVSCGENRFERNLVWFERGSVREGAEVNIGPGVRAGTFGFEGNLWFAGDGAGRSRVRLPVEEVGGVVGLDPLLMDVEGGDFRLRAGSAAVGVGGGGARIGDMEGLCAGELGVVGAYEP